jgi:hypothetical protein
MCTLRHQFGPTNCRRHLYKKLLLKQNPSIVFLSIQFKVIDIYKRTNQELMSFIFVLTKPHAVKSSNYLDLQVNIIVNFNKTVGDQKKNLLVYY